MGSGSVGGPRAAHLARSEPGHEELVRIRPGAEDLLPATLSPGALRLPALTKIRPYIATVLVQGIDQFARHRAGECGRRGGTAVERSDIILQSLAENKSSVDSMIEAIGTAARDGIENVRPGDEVVLLGTQGSERINAEELGRKWGTIN